MGDKRFGTCRFAALVATALTLSFSASACSSSVAPAVSPSPSPSLPRVVATVSANTARRAFDRYLTDRVSHIYNAAFPGASWRFHGFGPATADSATFVLSVQFALGSPTKTVRSWATYSVTRDRAGQAWTVARISPPAQRVLPTPLRTVGP